MATNLQPKDRLGKRASHHALAESVDVTNHHDSFNGRNTSRIPQTHQGIRRTRSKTISTNVRRGPRNQPKRRHPGHPGLQNLSSIP